MILYKGTKPYMILQTFQQVLLSQSNKFYPKDNLEMIDNDEALNRQYRALMVDMWKQNSDDTSVKLAQGVRIKRVHALDFDEYENIEVALGYSDGMWVLNVLSDALPADFKNGVYEATLRVSCSPGFWNRVKGHNMCVNSFMDVKCELRIDFGRYMGPLTPPAPAPVHWAVALWNDFRETFDMA